MRGQTFDEERIHINVARLKKGGETFEVVIDPDAAVLWKESGEGDISEIVNAEKIFSDAKKGMLASDEHIKSLFGTDEFEKVAEHILKEGEIQLTTEHRDKVREQKRNRVITYIHRNAIDPKSGNPHPQQRIILAFEEAKIKIDEFKSVEKQIPDIVRKLQPILPIKLEKLKLHVHVPRNYAGKMFGEISRIAQIQKEQWNNDGSWEADVELPAGIKNELIELINNITHGGAVIEEKKV